MASSPKKCIMLWAVWEQPVLVLACAYASCELNPVQEVTGHHSGLQGTKNVCTLPICKLMHAYTAFIIALLLCFCLGAISHPWLQLSLSEWPSDMQWLEGVHRVRWLLCNGADVCVGCTVGQLGTFLQHLRSFSCKTCFYLLGKACALFVHC